MIIQHKAFLVFVIFYIIIIFNIISGVLAKEPENRLFKDVLYSGDLNVKQEKIKQDPTIVRSSFVQINFKYLETRESMKQEKVIVLNLFNDVSLIAIKERIEKRSPTKYTWFGHLRGIKDSQVILVVEEGHMAGNITFDGEMYQVRSIGNGVHAIYEIDQSAFPEEGEPLPIE